MQEQLYELLHQCALRIAISGRAGHGTGFFVAPGLILTCAHVVKEHPLSAIEAFWNNQLYPVQLTRYEPDSDLALLSIDLKEHPSVWLNEEATPFDSLYSYGYPDDYPDGDVATFTLEGRAGDERGHLKFKSGQVRPGLSGAPLLNTRTGGVCGVVRKSRDRGTDLGGRAIPTTVVLHTFPELAGLQLQFHEHDQRWSSYLPSEQDERTQELWSICSRQIDYVQDRLNRFVGREAELQALRERIDDKMAQGGYVVITGDVGQGKSSIIAKMIEQQGIETTAYHFVQYNSGNDYRTTLLRKLIACLMLKYQLPEYYFESENYATLSGYFARVLEDVVRRGGQEVIYIDGVDQLTTRGVDEHGLGFLPAQLPHGIVIVVGTRPNDTLTDLRTATGGQDLHPYPLGALRLDDFKLLLPPRDEQPLSPALVKQLYEAMKGNALYLGLLAQELKESQDIRPEEIITHIENNPNAIFTLTFQRIKQQSETNWDTVIRPTLGILLVAREALTQQQIARICSLEGYRIRDGIARLGGLLTNLSAERHSLFHSKLSEYLRQNPGRPEEAYEFDLAEEQQWHSKLADWCSQWSNERLWSKEVDPPESADDREYARKHYVAHLHHANDYQTLFTVLDNGDYERGKLQVDPSTRSTVLDLLWGCEDAARVVSLSGAGEASPAANLEALARLWRYTLLKCSLATQADTYPIEAFQALLALGRERQALDLAELLTQPMRKVTALTLVMQWLLTQPAREAEGLQVCDRAYKVIATSIMHKAEQVRSFGHLAASLQRVNQQARAGEFWQSANQTMNSITNSDERAEALRSLTEAYTQAGMWEQAETAARMISIPIEQVGAWGYLLLAFGRAGLTARADAINTAMQALITGDIEQAVQDRANSAFALALAQDGQIEDARSVAGQISLRRSEERDAARVRIEAELAIANADAWEQSWRTIYDIVERYSSRTPSQINDALVDLVTALASQQRWEQAQAVAEALSSNLARGRALMSIVCQLAGHGQSTEAATRWKEARALCSTQIDQVGARVAGIIASALVKARQVKQAETFVGHVPTDIAEHVRSEIAIALVTIGQIGDARKVANDIIDPQAKDNARSSIAPALMEAGEDEQALTMACDIDNRRQRWQVLDELVTICCVEQRWDAAQSAAANIDDPDWQAVARSRMLSALVRAGRTKQAEKIADAISNTYYKLRAFCDLVTVFTQVGSKKTMDRYIKSLQGNKQLQAKAICSRYIVLNYIDGARSTAMEISEGDERREALRDVAIAYAGTQLWDKALAVVEMISDGEKQDEVREILAIEFARAGQWERAIATLEAIQKQRDLYRDRHMVILQEWGTRLAEAENSGQREIIARRLNDPGERACLLVSVADALAQAGRYTEQLHVIQQAWLQAGTKDDCVNLFAAVQGVILRDPEASMVFYDALTWVNTFLSE